MLVVPGSESVRRQAEEEGLNKVFLEAGAEWRYSGCSMCLAMNGDQLIKYLLGDLGSSFLGKGKNIRDGI